MGLGAIFRRGTPDPAVLLFRVIWQSHVNAALAALAQDRGTRIVRVGAGGVQFSGSALLSIWTVEADHFEQLARTVVGDYEKRAPGNISPPSALCLSWKRRPRHVGSVAGRGLCQTPMRGPEDRDNAEKFRNRTVLHLEGVIEAELRKAVHTAEANKEPWWKRAVSALLELVKLARP